MFTGSLELSTIDGIYWQHQIDFPELETGGGFKIHNNSVLSEVSGFPKLKQVHGAIGFVAYFTNVTLPSLEAAQGGFNFSQLRGWTAANSG